MVEPYDDLLSGAMREYDINSMICFNGVRDQIDPSESYTSELPFNEETSYRNKTSDVMETVRKNKENVDLATGAMQEVYNTTLKI